METKPILNASSAPIHPAIPVIQRAARSTQTGKSRFANRYAKSNVELLACVDEHFAASFRKRPDLLRMLVASESSMPTIDPQHPDPVLQAHLV
ncbi:MAG: hypothetical protein ABSB15_15390 [Bryobacteraceae bacterium]